MGHAVLTKTHQRYGHFDEDYLASAMASVEAVLLDLDERTGGCFSGKNQPRPSPPQGERSLEQRL